MDGNLPHRVIILNTNKLIDSTKGIREKNNSKFIRLIKNKFLNEFLNEKIDRKTKRIIILVSLFLFFIFLVLLLIFAFGNI